MTESPSQPGLPPPRESRSAEGAPGVAIYCWPQRGHVHPTMHLARRLRRRGARVVYLGFERGERMVREQGFEYEVVGCESEITGAFTRARGPEVGEFLDALWSRWSERLGALGATRVLVDPMLPHAAIAALRGGLPVWFLWAFEPPRYRKGGLPFTSSLALRKAGLARARPRLLWAPRLLAGHARLFASLVRGRLAGRRMFLAEAASFGFRPVFTSYGYLPELPSIVLGPRAFATSDDARYLGLGVDRERVEPDWQGRPAADVVFCSFGSNFDRYAAAGKVLGEVLETAARMPEQAFVVQAPARHHAALRVPRNVTLVETAPALRILAGARAAILHGGYGMVKECIEYGVPSVLIPFGYDQPDNAARMEEAGTAVALSPRAARADRIHAALTRVSSDAGFRARIRRLREDLHREDEAAAFVEELCSTTVGGSG